MRWIKPYVVLPLEVADKSLDMVLSKKEKENCIRYERIHVHSPEKIVYRIRINKPVDTVSFIIQIYSIFGGTEIVFPSEADLFSAEPIIVHGNLHAQPRDNKKQPYENVEDLEIDRLCRSIWSKLVSSEIAYKDKVEEKPKIKELGESKQSVKEPRKDTIENRAQRLGGMTIECLERCDEIEKIIGNSTYKKVAESLSVSVVTLRNEYLRKMEKFPEEFPITYKIRKKNKRIYTPKK